MRRSLLWCVVMMWMLVACGGDRASELPDGGAADASPDAFLEPPPEGAGFQIELQPFTVAAQEELYYCYSVPLPATGFDLDRIEARFSIGAHHLLVSTIDGAEPAGQGACSAAEFGHGIDLFDGFTRNLRFLSGAQTPYATDPRTDLDLEDGMAFRVRDGSTLLLQLHWVNAGDAPMEAATAINLWYAAPDPERLLESFFFYHGDIALPPGQETEVAGRCTFDDPIEVVGMVSHMHARGVDFTTHRHDGALGELVYQEPSWQEPQMKMWPGSDLLHVAGGGGLEFRCTFQNATADWIYEGDGAGDEMCMLIGLYSGGAGTLWGFPGGGFPAGICTAVP